MSAETRRQAAQARAAKEQALMWDATDDEYKRWIAMIDKAAENGDSHVVDNKDGIDISPGCTLLLERDGYIIDRDKCTGRPQVRWNWLSMLLTFCT